LHLTLQVHCSQKLGKTSVLQPNHSALAKSAVDLQSSMLYLAEPEIDEIEDDDKSPMFSNLQRHGPILLPID